MSEHRTTYSIEIDVDMAMVTERAAEVIENVVKDFGARMHAKIAIVSSPRAATVKGRKVYSHDAKGVFEEHPLPFHDE